MGTMNWEGKARAKDDGTSTVCRCGSGRCKDQSPPYFSATLSTLHY